MKILQKAGSSVRAKKRFDLAKYPLFYMAHIIERNAANLSLALEEQGLGHSDWRVLACLQYADGLTVKDLARDAVLERSFVSRLVMQLEEKGLVRRQRPADDRRVTRIYLTQSGLTTFTNFLLPAALEQNERALAGLSASEVAQFIRTLTQVMQNVYRSANQRIPLLELHQAPALRLAKTRASS